jgi:uncharacterized protein (TIGR00255 family)
MIVSMTGYGAAQLDDGGDRYALEIRSVNNRYLKVHIKLPENLLFAEPEIERLIRTKISRGTVTCTFRRRSDATEVARSLNIEALQRYVDLLSGIKVASGIGTTIDLAAVAQFPGVSEAADADETRRQHTQDVLLDLTRRGMDAMTAMRREEGKALAVELRDHCETIKRELDAVFTRAPLVVQEYHDRLKTRVSNLMQTGGFELAADGLMREVAIYAERCDITEEIGRLRSHLDQFVQHCDRDEQVGRTLDFLAQELLREANTIGSKSNDTTIARAVVQIKSMIDRIKEQVQNVE